MEAQTVEAPRSSGIISTLLKTPLLTFTIGVTLEPSPASAQMTPPPPMPMVVDLNKIDLGTCGSYSMVVGQMTMTAKFALVARDASSMSMETSMEGGMMAIVGVGKGAKAGATKAPKPFDPQR